MSNYSLLVADDEEIPRRHILEDISWDTLNIRPLYQASTGWEALALLLKHQPDILILSECPASAGFSSWTSWSSGTALQRSSH